MNNIKKLIEQVRHSSREMVRELGLLAKDEPYGLPLSFRHVLIEINQRGPLTSVELASLLQLDKSTISRMINKLMQQALIEMEVSDDDQRLKRLFLTALGKSALNKINLIADDQVNHALLLLSTAEQKNVTEALSLYAKALKCARLQTEYVIRPIAKRDNAAMMLIIKKVLKEFNADKPGFAFVDPELADLHKAFNKNNSAYVVIERKADGKLIGGAGIGPLQGGDASICELKKMYLSVDARGLGLGHRLLQAMLTCARDHGYKKCYLETLKSMHKANQLYTNAGFAALSKPLGNTGHFGCDIWYLLKLGM